MSNVLKAILGILSVLGFVVVPILIGYLLVGFVPEMIALDQQGLEPSPEQLLPVIGLFIGVILLVGLISFGLMIFYIIHVAQDKTATSDDRILWILLLVFFSNFALPFYWYFRIRKSNSLGGEAPEKVLDEN